MQCGRDRLPTLREVVSFDSAMGAATGRPPGAATSLVLVPSASTRLGDTVIDRAGTIELLVGPESGFTDTELDRARAARYAQVRLGPRTLRTETAGLAAIAALQALAGDF